MERLPPGYHALYDRVVATLHADERVRALWMSGSLARGDADRASDLDFLAAVADDSHECFAAEWRQWVDAITPTVLVDVLPFLPGSIHAITPAYERFDVVVERVGALPTTPFRSRSLIFDRAGEAAMVPPPERGEGPNAGRVTKLVTDWFHFTGMLETVVWRDEWLLGTEHVQFMRSQLYQLYVEANAPLPSMGLKRWTQKLTEDQASVLASLPTAVHSRDDLVDAHLAYSNAFLEVARPLAVKLEVKWPAALEAAATAHLRDVLGIEEPYG